MEKDLLIKLGSLIENTGSHNPITLLQSLGNDLIFTDGLPDGMEAWADGNITPIGLAGFIFFNIALKTKPVLYMIAAKELMKLLTGCYNDPRFFQSLEYRKQVETIVDKIAKKLVSEMEPVKSEPSFDVLSCPSYIAKRLR